MERLFSIGKGTAFILVRFDTTSAVFVREPQRRSAILASGLNSTKGIISCIMAVRNVYCVAARLNGDGRGVYENLSALFRGSKHEQKTKGFFAD